jgi:RNA methyltransferase, TrmH family
MSKEFFENGPRKVGQVKEITSLANPIVKDIKALTQKKSRGEAGAFLAEGLKLVIDALDLGWSIRTLVYAKTAKGRPLVEQVAARTVAAGGLVLEVSEKIIGSITRRDNPQLVVGIFEQRWVPLKNIHPAEGETLVALDRVRDPGNLGTIIRTADAAGASGVILVGETTDPFSLETVRATMGSVFAVPVARATAEEFLAWKRTAGVTVVATHLAGAVDYRAIDYRKRPVVLLMGNEQSGLPDALANEADALARIPQAGRAAIFYPFARCDDRDPDQRTQIRQAGTVFAAVADFRLHRRCRRHRPIGQALGRMVPAARRGCVFATYAGTTQNIQSWSCFLDAVRHERMVHRRHAPRHRCFRAVVVATYRQESLARTFGIRADHFRRAWESGRSLSLRSCHRLYTLPHGKLVLRGF